MELEDGGCGRVELSEGPRVGMDPAGFRPRKLAVDMRREVVEVVSVTVKSVCCSLRTKHWWPLIKMTKEEAAPVRTKGFRAASPLECTNSP